MRKIFIVICFVVLLSSFITILNSGNVHGLEEIMVAINEGTVDGSYTTHIENAIDGFSWVVGDTEYKFTAERIDMFKILEQDILKIENYHVHIIDGVTNEWWTSIWNKDLRDKLDSFITSGGGYIGRCGGSILPLFSRCFHFDGLRNNY